MTIREDAEARENHRTRVTGEKPDRKGGIPQRRKLPDLVMVSTVSLLIFLQLRESRKRIRAQWGRISKEERYFVLGTAPLHRPAIAQRDEANGRQRGAAGLAARQPPGLNFFACSVQQHIHSDGRQMAALSRLQWYVGRQGSGVHQTSVEGGSATCRRHGSVQSPAWAALVGDRVGSEATY